MPARKSTDVFSKKKRSEVMASINGKGNETTEVRFKKILKTHRIRGWRSHLPLPGRPDFTFPKAKICVFIHGCFWHGCKTCYRKPKSNVAYWSLKILQNTARDRRATRKLRRMGYSVLVYWECKLSRSDVVINKLRATFQRHPQGSLFPRLG